MSRQIKGIHEEDENETEELKFIIKVNDGTFPYRVRHKRKWKNNNNH